MITEQEQGRRSSGRRRAALWPLCASVLSPVATSSPARFSGVSRSKSERFQEAVVKKPGLALRAAEVKTQYTDKI